MRRMDFRIMRPKPKDPPETYSVKIARTRPSIIRDRDGAVMMKFAKHQIWQLDIWLKAFRG